MDFTDTDQEKHKTLLIINKNGLINKNRLKKKKFALGGKAMATKNTEINARKKIIVRTLMLLYCTFRQ